MSYRPANEMTAMHLSIEYPCRVDGIVRGRRRVEIAHEWRRAELMIRELPASAVLDAARIVQSHKIPVQYEIPGRPMVPNVKPADTIVKYFTLEDGGLFKSTPMAEIELSIERRRAYFEVLKLPYSRTVEGLQNFKEIVKDHGASSEASASKAAASMFISDGKLYHPVMEPVVKLDIDGNGRFQFLDIDTFPGYGHGGFHRFRLPDFEIAVAMAIDHGATPDQVAEIRERLTVDVTVPSVFTLDARIAKLVKAAFVLKENHAPTLSSMHSEDIMTWTRLRDGFVAWQAGPETDRDTLADLVEAAYPSLAKYGKVKPFEIKAMQDAIRENRSVSEDLKLMDEIELDPGFAP